MNSPRHSSPDRNASLPTDLSGEDSRLGALVDEVLEKLGRGEQVDVQDYVARNPQAAEILRHALPALRAVADFSSSGSRPQTQAAAWPGGDTLGDFRILGELGRGGMGVVYEAEQISLGRRVALKVLPLAGTRLGKGLQRFRNEVRAAAALDHPRIVSVYSVGDHQGVHYYAMQLIRGQTLAELICQLRLSRSRSEPLDAKSLSQMVPVMVSDSIARTRAESADTERPGAASGTANTSGASGASGASGTNAASEETSRVARTTVDTVGGSQEGYYRGLALLGIQAADALQHAHDHGVLHRDIKPGNLMLDTNLQLYVTDFGLARIESDPGLTATGDVLGTLRYMSPEQALGQRTIIDQRSDVYSLGATLYELFALQPMFATTDRQELLTQIAQHEPPTLRKLQRAIPRDLETIVAKATEKSPSARYLTCSEMADDLRAYLEHRPIKARLATWQQRTGKWARRHRAVVTTATIGGTLLLCFAAGLMLWALQRETDLRQVAEQRAVALNAERRSVYANLYKADMRLAAVDSASDNATRLLRTLTSHLPEAHRDDVREDNRGWEWYYLLSRCQQHQATLIGHCAPVHGVAWSADDKYIATTSYDGDAKVWDAETFQLVRSFQGSSLYKRGVAWAPDACRLAWTSVGDENAIRIWDVHTDQIQLLRGHTHSVNHVAWSPDGRRLASSSMDQTVKVWDLDSGDCLRTLSGHAYHVFPVCWSPDGQWIVAGDETSDGLRIWDAGSGKATERPQIAGIMSMDWSPDGKRLAVGTIEGQCQLWNPHTWTLERSIDAHSGKVWDLDWDATSTTLGSAGEDGLLHLWDVDGQHKRTFRGHHGKINSIAWQPDGTRLVSGGEDGDVKIWDLRQPLQPAVLDTQTTGAAIGSLNSLAWTPTPGQLAVGGKLGRITYDFHSQTVIENVASPNKNTFWHPHGATWARVRWANGQSTILMERIADGERFATLANIDGTQFVWSPDGQQVAIRVWKDNQDSVLVWDMHHDRLVCKYGPIYRIRDMAWSTDGRYLAIGGQGEVSAGDEFRGRVFVLDTSEGRLLWKWNMGNHNVSANCVDWSPDGGRLVAGNRAGVIRIWDVRSGVQLVSGYVHTAEVNAIAWSPDGKRLASAGKDRQVRILDASTAADLIAFTVQDEPQLLSWHPAGTSLASANQDSGRVHIWDAAHTIQSSNSRQRDSRLRFAAAKELASAQDWEAAIAGYTQAIERDPHNWRNWIERAKCHFRLKQWQQVVEDAAHCLELHTGYYSAYRYRADAYSQLGMWQQALDDYDKVLELIADYPLHGVLQQRAHAQAQLQP